jgi:lipopolysaccharide/colanic/teichoic acid biosynthesis glycosyltransferase
MNSQGVNCTHHAGREAIEACTVPSGVPSWKRVLDLTLILLSLPIVLPVGFLLALIVRIASPGPILFRQERVGYRGGRFLCLKFRTMKINADVGVHQGHLDTLMKSDAPMVKLDARGDDRLVPFGLIIRSLGLDELPQLINVVRGEMSLVGPRPCIPYEFQQYLPRHRRRCDTLPGLTGLWQVKGKNRTTFERMIELDLEYVRRKSVFLDLWIIFMTIPAILVQVWQVKFSRR